jgi:Holliday junction resolvasome RuvABC endonuclease subunit
VRSTRTVETRVLTLDLSSTCIGWAVGTDDEVLINYGKLVLTDDRHLAEHLEALATYLRVILLTYRPTLILVERPVALGRTSITHNQVLGAVRLVSAQTLGLIITEADLVSPNTIKKATGVVAGRDHDHNKALMVNHVNETLGLHLQYDKHSKLKTDDDTADAIAILLARWATLTSEDSR